MVLSLRVLGVVLNSKLTMMDHIIETLKTCSSSTYALRLLCSHGLQSRKLHLVARVTTVATMLYVAPPWWGPLEKGTVSALNV